MNLEMTPDLAEICGIHAGDGYMRKRNKFYELEISGGFDEKEYYDFHVVPLFEKVFNIKLNAQYFKTKKTYGFRICKKKVCENLHACGFPFGKKTTIVAVPKQILESRNLDIIYRFIRGVFDTDGCLSFRMRKGSRYKKIHTLRHTLPEITFDSCSKNLRDGVSKLLIQTGFHFSFSERCSSINKNKIYRLSILGDQNVISWISNIGFKNTLKLNRFLIWKKFGFCPSGLDLNTQKKVLFKKINPNLFYATNINPLENTISSTATRQLTRLKYLNIAIPKE
jgi:hypothetical protein